jgi:hypothetical protein
MAQAAAESAKLIRLQIEKGSLPGALGTVQVTNPQSVTIDAKALEPKKADTAAGTSAPAPVEPNKNPVPAEDGTPEEETSNTTSGG